MRCADGDIGGVVVVLMEIGFFVSVCFTYPLLVFPLRQSIGVLLSLNPSSVIVCGLPNEQVRCERSARWCLTDCVQRRFYTISLGIITLSYFTAIVAPEVELVFQVVGATAGATLCYVLPSAMYMKASRMAGTDVISMSDVAQT